MHQRLLNYFKHISTYFSASLIPMLISLLTNPLIALNMSPEDYAITGYYGSFSHLLTPLILFYTVNFYNQRYFRVSPEERIRLKATIVRFLIYISATIALVSLVGVWGYIKLFNSESSLPIFPYLGLSIFAIPLTGIYALTLNECKLQRNSKKFFRISVSNGILGIALSLLFVVVFKDGARGKLLATFLVNLCFFIWCLWYNRDCFKIKFDTTILSDTLKFCWPLTIAAMLGFFTSGYDKILLEKLGDMQELGYYVVGAQFAGYLHVFTTAIQATFQPDIYENIAQKNARKTALYILVMLGAISGVVFVFYIAAPWVVDILTAGRYIESVTYSRILAIANITSTAYFASSQITIALGKTRVTLLNKSICTVLIILMFNIMIANYGFIGAAWGTVLSNILLLVMNISLLFISLKIQNKNGIKNTSNR